MNQNDVIVLLLIVLVVLWNMGGIANIWKQYEEHEWTKGKRRELLRTFNESALAMFILDVVILLVLTVYKQTPTRQQMHVGLLQSLTWCCLTNMIIVLSWFVFGHVFKRIYRLTAIAYTVLFSVSMCGAIILTLVKFAPFQFVLYRQ